MAMSFDPFSELDRLTGSLLQFRPGPRFMPVDLYRDGEQYVLNADLPGVDPGSVDLDVDGQLVGGVPVDQPPRRRRVVLVPDREVEVLGEGDGRQPQPHGPFARPAHRRGVGGVPGPVRVYMVVRRQLVGESHRCGFCPVVHRFRAGGGSVGPDAYCRRHDHRCPAVRDR